MEAAPNLGSRQPLVAGLRSGAGVYNSRLSHSNSANFSISSVDKRPKRTSLILLPPLEFGSTSRGLAPAGGAAVLMVSAPCVTLRVMNFRALLRRATVWRRCLGYCSASPKLYATVRESLALQHALRSCYSTNYDANRIAASRRTAAFCCSSTRRRSAQGCAWLSRTMRSRGIEASLGDSHAFVGVYSKST